MTTGFAVRGHSEQRTRSVRADAKTVLFNSDRTGLAQIHAAILPDGLLASLDG